MKSHTRTNNNRLGGYLTAAVSCGTLLSHTHAAVVALDVSSIAGPNGNFTENVKNFSLASLSADVLTGTLRILDHANTQGFDGEAGMSIATAYNNRNVSPRNFGYNTLIDATANFEDSTIYTVFRFLASASRNFGVGSFIGFRSANGHYGYLETTWDGATRTFEVLSGG